MTPDHMIVQPSLWRLMLETAATQGDCKAKSSLLELRVNEALSRAWERGYFELNAEKES